MRHLFFCLLSLGAIGCSSSDESAEHSSNSSFSGEYIYRESGDMRLEGIDSYVPKAKPIYPWQGLQETGGKIRPRALTKEYFRCKGFALNPPKIIKNDDGKEVQRYTDCGGAAKHSLPIRNSKEYVFPVLLELVNHIQEVTKKQVIITSGHRCPDHNSYIDPTPQNSGSKHLIAAACEFYIKGLEHHPEVAVKIIQDYYKNDSRFQHKEYQEFKRFEKATNVSTAPWYNKEVFIKLYKVSEGRNDDNRHSYPYISLQVRFDRERNVPLTFSYPDTQKFLRK